MKTLKKSLLSELIALTQLFFKFTQVYKLNRAISIFLKVPLKIMTQMEILEHMIGVRKDNPTEQSIELVQPCENKVALPAGITKIYIDTRGQPMTLTQ